MICKRTSLNLFMIGFIVFISLMLFVTPVKAYLGGYTFGASPPLLDLDLDLDRLAAFYYPMAGVPGGLYSLYGFGTIYDAFMFEYLLSLSGLGSPSNIQTNPFGLGNNFWNTLGYVYHPVFGYYHPLDTFNILMSLTGLLSWY